MVNVRGWARYRIEENGVGVTVSTLDSGAPGPRLLVLGGVHGDEVGGVLAAGIVASTPWELTGGRLDVVPVTHEAAYRADSRTSPVDGENLARTFPGRPEGSPTQRLAHLVAERLIAEADVLIDLHTSHTRADMPLFLGCVDDGTTSGDRAVELAVGSGTGTIWTHPSLGPGRTLSVAQARGIPALYMESPVGGVLDDYHVSEYVRVVAAIQRQLGMLPASAGSGNPTPPDLWLHGPGDADLFAAVETDGLFRRDCRLLDEVSTGDPIGTVLDVYGDRLEVVTAPRDGVVTTLQRAAVVAAGTPVVGVTGRRPSRLGLVSDRFFTERRDHHE